ncbi:MAG: CopD family protein [Thermoproteota archaeon]|nr:CopD family protein [Thermoproteota archaeon]
MSLIDSLLTWVHLVTASIWVGGSIFLGIVLAPMLKSITGTLEERIALMIKIGRRFNKIAMPSLAILIITGIYNSHVFLQEPSLLFRTNYGIILLFKIILVIATIITYIIHIRTLNSETEKTLSGGYAETMYVQSIRSKIILLGRITVILSVAILLLAAILDSGGY